MAGDLVAPGDEHHDGMPLLVPVMRGGRRIAASPTLAEIRRRAADEFAHLPPGLRTPGTPPYPVTIGDGLRRLAEACDERIARAEAMPPPGGPTSPRSSL